MTPIDPAQIPVDLKEPATQPGQRFTRPGAEVFRDRFTVFPDSGIVDLHCYRCQPGDSKARWAVGYHPSLDILIEQATAHNRAVHGGE